MNDWTNGTTYAPQGAFFNRDLQGNVAGVTPGGQQGAFGALGGALQGGAGAYMRPKHTNPLGAAAEGFAGAFSQPNAPTPNTAGTTGAAQSTAQPMAAGAASEQSEGGGSGILEMLMKGQGIIPILMSQRNGGQPGNGKSGGLSAKDFSPFHMFGGGQ